jgi:LPXTG-site transpeptidase (sortase) family protein
MSMRKPTAIFLAALMFFSAVTGIWFLASPSLEQQKDLDNQQELLASIERNMDTAVSKAEPPTTDVADPISVPDNTRYIEFEAEQAKEPVPIGAELGILSIEKLGLKLPVVEGVTEELLKSAVGHVPETAAVGDIGNAVIAGHRSYTYGLYFNRLGELENGDIISYTSADGESCLFEVFEIIVIEPDDQIAFVQPTDESIITLYTCTPIREATHRLLVRAELIYEEECI